MLDCCGFTRKVNLPPPVLRRPQGIILDWTTWKRPRLPFSSEAPSFLFFYYCYCKAIQHNVQSQKIRTKFYFTLIETMKRLFLHYSTFQRNISCHKLDLADLLNGNKFLISYIKAKWLRKWLFKIWTSDKTYGLIHIILCSSLLHYFQDHLAPIYKHAPLTFILVGWNTAEKFAVQKYHPYTSITY